MELKRGPVADKPKERRYGAAFAQRIPDLKTAQVELCFKNAKKF
jgi:hypothetical protein